MLLPLFRRPETDTEAIAVPPRKSALLIRVFRAAKTAPEETDLSSLSFSPGVFSGLPFHVLLPGVLPKPVNCVLGVLPNRLLIPPDALSLSVLRLPL